MAKPESARRKPRFRERNAVRQRSEAPVRHAAPPPPLTAVPSRDEHAARRAAIPQITLEQSLYSLLLAGGFALRLWDIGSRAMHGDEAEHAWFAWHLYSGTGYQYDPVYHGPLQFIVTAFLFFLFGVSDTVARLMAVLFGTALIGMPVFLRQYMGRSASLIAAAFLAVSPAFLYVSRLERDDIFSAFFALTLAISIFSYVRTRRVRYLYIAGTAVALSLAAMENTYITVFVFASFLAIVLVSEWLARSSYRQRLLEVWDRTGTTHIVHVSFLFVVIGLLLAAFVLLTTTGFFLPFLTILALLLVLLVHRQSFLEASESGDSSFTHSIRAVSWQQWLNALTIVVAILFLTFSTLGTNLRGVWDHTQPLLNSRALYSWNIAHGCDPGTYYFMNPCRKDIVGGLFYWLSQHNVHRGSQPWFYYSFLFALYEQIAVVLGVGGIIWFLRRPTLFTAFLTYWAVLMFGIYSWAGEKFPWLMIHPLLPFTLLAAMFVADVLRVANPLKWMVVAVLVLLTLLELHSAYEVNYVNGANPIEMMVYVQSAPDTPLVANNILSISNKVTNGNDLFVTIDADDSWPFAWYLRNMPNIAYPKYPDMLQKRYSTNPVIIVDDAHEPAMHAQLAKQYTGHHYILRWWFPETYKSLTWASFWSDLRDPGYWRVVTDWLIQRRPFEPFSPSRTVSFYYYVKNGLVSPY